MAYPANLHRAHEEGLRVRALSIPTIEKSETLSAHSDMIELTADLLHFFGHDGPIKDDDDLIIRVLGFRAFNDLMTATDLILAGYYQPAVMIARDLLELTFLLDDFTGDPGLIAQWRTLREREHYNVFSPSEVRKRIDKRGNFQGKKREQQYKFMSDLAGHPSPTGMQMLLNNGNYGCGPFFSGASLDACWSELAKVAVQVGMHFTRFFRQADKASAMMKVEFLELSNAWAERFFGNRAITVEQMQEMRALAERLPR